jgi:hypothetical protein
MTDANTMADRGRHSGAVSYVTRYATYAVVVVAILWIVKLVAGASSASPELMPVNLYWEYAGRILGMPWTEGYPEWIHSRVGDIPSVAGTGSLAPYTDFTVEYPPGAIAYFVLLRALFPDLQAFAAAHYTAMGVCLLVTMVAARRAAQDLDVSSWAPALSWVTALSFVVLLGGLSIMGFDALSTALVALGLLAATRGHLISAGSLIGLAASVKLWPLFILPFLFTSQSGRIRALFVLVSSAVVAFLVAHSWAHAFGTQWRDMFSYLEFASLRPIQEESALAFMARLLDAGSPVTAWSYGSVELVSPVLPFPTSLAVVAFLAFAAGSALYVNVLRTEGPSWDGIMAWPLAVVAFLLLSSKVFSPEYILWLMPLVMVLSFWTQLVALPLCILMFLGMKLFFIAQSGRFGLDPESLWPLGLKVTSVAALGLWAIRAGSRGRS